MSVRKKLSEAFNIRNSLIASSGLGAVCRVAGIVGAVATGGSLLAPLVALNAAGLAFNGASLRKALKMPKLERAPALACSF